MWIIAVQPYATAKKKQTVIIMDFITLFSFCSLNFCILCLHWDWSTQAQAALMYDAVFVLVEAFNKLLRKKPDQFRSYTMRRSSAQHTFTNSSYGNNMVGSTNGQSVRILDCNTNKGWVNPWEHGDKISRYLRKVSFNAIDLASWFLSYPTLYSIHVAFLLVLFVQSIFIERSGVHMKVNI